MPKILDALKPKTLIIQSKDPDPSHPFSNSWLYTLTDEQGNQRRALISEPHPESRGFKPGDIVGISPIDWLFSLFSGIYPLSSQEMKQREVAIAKLHTLYYSSARSEKPQQPR